MQSIYTNKQTNKQMRMKNISEYLAVKYSYNNTKQNKNNVILVCFNFISFFCFLLLSSLLLYECMGRMGQDFLFVLLFFFFFWIVFCQFPYHDKNIRKLKLTFTMAKWSNGKCSSEIDYCIHIFFLLLYVCICVCSFIFLLKFFFLLSSRTVFMVKCPVLVLHDYHSFCFVFVFFLLFFVQ